MSTPSPAPDERPSVARIYDYLLGGYHNFAADRVAAEQLVRLYPDLPLTIRANRAFLRRAVLFLTSQGIEQFLDVGSGIPTVGNVHEVAQARSPSARVVYVDSDPVAVAQSAALLADNPRATAIQADARQPEAILAHPETRRLVDFRRPVAVLLVALLHFMPDEAEATRIVWTLRDAVAPGSYLAITHAVHGGEAVSHQQSAASAAYSRAAAPFVLRTQAQVARFFEGLELVEPGLVLTPLWRPEGPEDLLVETPEQASGVAGIGRKP